MEEALRNIRLTKRLIWIAVALMTANMAFMLAGALL